VGKRVKKYNLFAGALFNPGRDINLVKFIKTQYGNDTQVSDFLFRQALNLLLTYSF